MTNFCVGSRIASEVIANYAVNDGLWHRVDIFHDEREIFLFVDGVKFNQTQAYGSNYRLDLDRKLNIFDFHLRNQKFNHNSV